MENTYSENSFVPSENILVALESNPLNDLISDDIYELLKRNGLFNEVSVRDRVMRRKFKILRAKKISTNDAIEMLMTEYPYLQYDTVKKIVHHPKKYVQKTS